MIQQYLIKERAGFVILRNSREKFMDITLKKGEPLALMNPEGFFLGNFHITP